MTSPAPEVVVDLRGERIGAASDRIVQTATSLGYSVVAVGPGSFRLARTRRPTWAIVMAVLFGICAVGLLFLLVKRTESAVITVYEDRTGTKARIVGVVDPRLSASVAATPDADPGPVTVPVVADVPVPPVAAAPIAPAPVTQTPASFAPPGAATVTAVPLPDDFGATVVRPLRQSVAASAAIRLPSGVLVAVTQPVVVGRNPDPTRHPGAEVVVVADPSLSKTHATIAPSSGGVTVVDLHSTNGTHVVRGEVTLRCTPDQPEFVPLGSIVRVGEVDVRIEALG